SSYSSSENKYYAIISMSYLFLSCTKQLHIKANKIVSAQAGLDSRKAPDVLQTTQLECSFS
ncbi:hypothetical protein, partial [Acinetobacter baumannii]|uniref:hypothetical protein n=1 Tax=Acinetobacter baumannii TaxID=470 RepID=UPI001BC87BF7